MRVLVSALGSAGDVHPFVAMAEVLLAHGHDVTIIASPTFEQRIGRSGATFAPYGTAADYDALCPIRIDPPPTELVRVGLVLTEFAEAGAAR